MGTKIKIAGWSPYRRSGGVTGHVLAMGEMAADYYGKQVDIRSDHFGVRSMESYIGTFRRIGSFSENEDFYSGPDFPNYSGCLVRYEIRYKSACKGVSGVYAPGANPRLLSPVRFYEESAFGGGNGEVCFVDSSGRNSPYSFGVLNEADLILVFLPDNPVEIRRFFHLYSYYLSKCFFFINYHSQDNSYVFDILEAHRVSRDRMVSMPYSPEFARACRERDVDGLIRRQISDRQHGDYFKRIREITKKVLIEAEKQAMFHEEQKMCIVHK